MGSWSCGVVVTSDEGIMGSWSCGVVVTSDEGIMGSWSCGVVVTSDKGNMGVGVMWGRGNFRPKQCGVVVT